MVTFVKASCSIKSHDQQTLHEMEGNRYVPHMKYTWTKVWGHEMFHVDIIIIINVSDHELSTFCQSQTIYHVHDQFHL